MHTILLTFDVEDWFQVENLRPWNPPSTWHERELRVERSTHRILDLLDAFSALLTKNQRSGVKDQRSGVRDQGSGVRDQGSDKPGTKNQEPGNRIQATFFILGWVAERCPGLVREIQSRGYEVASHGRNHLLCTGQDPAALRRDLTRSRALLEDLIGAPVLGYRAPSFSISEAVLDQIREAGYAYDSSYNSFALHHRYGRIAFRRTEGSGVAMQYRPGFYELPVSNLLLGRKVIPWGGGGYFRLLPSLLFIPGVRKILKDDGVYVMYLHSWEFDPEQPRVKQVSWQFGFRHYVNLHKTGAKLERLVRSCARCRFVACADYLGFGEEAEGKGHGA